MVNWSGILRAVALAVGIIISAIALTRLVIYSIYASKDDTDWPYNVMFQREKKTEWQQAVGLDANIKTYDNKSHRSYARHLILTLAVVNAVELIFDVILIFGIIKKKLRCLVVWTFPYILFIFLNFGLNVGLIVLFLVYEREDVTFPLFIYTGCNLLVSVMLMVLIQVHYSQAIRSEPSTDAPSVHYQVDGDTVSPSPPTWDFEHK